MKVVTNDYKAEIKKFGRQIDILIQYDDENELPVKLGNEEINSIDLHYDGNILKSVMKQLDIDSRVEIPKGTLIRYRFGVKVRDSEVYLIDYRQDYDYAEMGYYIVDKVEKLEDTNSYKITCYDKMLYSMVEYNNTGITYPITVRDYITAICNKMGVTFTHSSGTFINYNQQITEEPYLDENGNSLGYTFRDVLDEMAEITGSTLCINDSGNLEIKYITNSGVTITEDEIKNINVNFGEKYTVDVDIDAQVLNYMNRQTVLTNVYNAIDGTEYYLNDFESTGITYLNICDRYDVQIGETTYSCIMLSDDVNLTSGLKETIYTEKPKDTEEEYTYVNDTDKAVRKATITLNEKIGEVDIRGKTINLTANEIAISSTNFSVTKDGTINATAGNIAGWQLKKLASQNYKSYLGSDWGSGGNTYFLSQEGLSAGFGDFGQKDWYLYFKSKFGVTIDGELYALGGKIGNWDIGNQTATGEKWGGTAVPNNRIASIFNTTGPALIQLKNGATGAGYCGMKSTDGSFLYAGASTSCNQSNDAKFKVSHTGALTSTSGTIGGWTISNSSLGVNFTDSNVQWGVFLNKPTYDTDKVFQTGNDVAGDTAYIQANGTARFTSYGNISQEKYKKNFERLENALDIIKDTDIYKYNLKTEEDTDKKHIGLIIGDNYKYSKELTTKENDSVDLYSFVSVCCKAIQEQQQEIEMLKEEIKKLKKEN